MLASTAATPLTVGDDTADRVTVRPVTQTETRDRRIDGPTNEGEKICHIVTDDDPDTALCGKDVTGWPWNPPWPMCVVCVDLAEGP
jgi:hypothetical protein